eukprot:PITA_24456
MCEERRDCTVCVTGAGGFIASWLIKDLLLRGYNVNGTVMDPGDERETAHILSLPGAKERLRLFKANLLEKGSFDTAVQGCEFAILLATPMDFAIDAETQSSVVEAEVNGTLDILRACEKAKTVRRVIYTSSISAASPLNEKGEFGDCIDESCWSNADIIKRKGPLFWMYYLAKVSGEQTARQFGLENGIEVVTIAASLVAGPFLTPALPASVEEALAVVTGNAQCYEWLRELQHLIGSIALLHTKDVCRAHIFLMEHPSAQGRYICSSQSLTLRELGDFCRKRYPQLNLPVKFYEEEDLISSVPISSKKLLDMGFSFKYGLVEIFDDSIEFAKKLGFCHECNLQRN